MTEGMEECGASPSPLLGAIAVQSLFLRSLTRRREGGELRYLFSFGGFSRRFVWCDSALSPVGFSPFM